MKKLEQTILIILIVTCVGMCAGSLLIALSRNNTEGNDPSLSSTTQKLTFSASEEVEIERVMNSQVYRGIMHGLKFPDSFTNNTRLLTTELERFYFVFESLRILNSDRVSCVSLSPEAAPSECRFLESDFQNLATSIFGEEIIFGAIQSEHLYRNDGFITCDYDASLDQSAFILKFRNATLTGSIYEIQMDMYTSIQNGTINYEEIKNFATASYISRNNYFGTLNIQYKIVNEQKVITAVSFEKV